MDFFNNAKRNKILSSVVYIILALCVVTIMCIAIFTIANTGRNNKTPESGVVPKLPEMTTNTRKAVTEPIEATVIPPAVESGKVNNPLPEATPPRETEASEPTFEAVTPVEEPEPVSAEPEEFVIPVHGYITKGHHDDMLVYSLTMNDYRVHQGIDIGSSIGAPVFACAAGTIEAIYDEPFMGKTVTIDHGGGLKSHYKNLSTEMPQGIEEGAKVGVGQIIAGVGETSLIEMADTMHVHFEMTKDGLQVNPLDYIEYTASTFETIDIYYED